jgi:hypothetical protein
MAGVCSSVSVESIITQPADRSRKAASNPILLKTPPYLHFDPGSGLSQQTFDGAAW